jgi:hypothetical protein
MPLPPVVQHAGGGGRGRHFAGAVMQAYGCKMAWVTRDAASGGSVVGRYDTTWALMVHCPVQFCVCFVLCCVVCCSWSACVSVLLLAY